MTSCKTTDFQILDNVKIEQIDSFPIEVKTTTIVLQDEFTNCDAILKGSLVDKIVITTTRTPDPTPERLASIICVVDVYEKNKISTFRVEGDVVHKSCIIVDILGVPLFKSHSVPGNSFPIFAVDHYFSFKIASVEYTFMRTNATCYTFESIHKYFRFSLYATLLSEPIRGGPTITHMNKILKQNELIFVTSQLLIDLSDIGQTIFTDQGKEIIYEKSCPRIVDVLQGKGLTAWEKLNDIYVKYDIEIDGVQFVKNIVEYSMVKYFRTKLLYGKFIMKYLLQKYYLDFLKDLKQSKYKDFVPYFTQGKFQNYYTYFLK